MSIVLLNSGHWLKSVEEKPVDVINELTWKDACWKASPMLENWLLMFIVMTVTDAIIIPIYVHSSYVWNVTILT